MPLDYKRLEQLSATIPQPTGIDALVRSIHRDPALRDWVTLESSAFPPIPVYKNGHWTLISLLAVPAKQTDGTPAWFAPWGAIVWSMPELQVLQKIDLRQSQAGEALRQHAPIQAIDRTKANETDLYQALERFAKSPNLTKLPELAQHYLKLLPAEFVAFYHQFVPESRNWLKPAEELGEPIAHWLEKSRSLAKSFKLNEMHDRLEQLKHRQQLPGFRLAIVGEFSRGKSSLINRLLGRDLLPVSVTPTTAVLTSIVPAQEESMEINRENAVETRTLALESWQDLLATDSDGADRSISATVRMHIQHEWLESLDIELIDTPGAGDLNLERAERVSELLNQCDAAILVVSSTLPFSMTERSFLEQEVIGRHVSKILVVASKLDTLEMGARSQVLQVLRDRIAQVSAKIPVLPLHSVNPDGSDEQALQSIRDQIEVMVARDGRRVWRNRRIAGQLSACLEQMADLATAAIETETLQAQEREQALQQLERSLSTKQLQWEQIQLELDQRRRQREQFFRQHMTGIQQDLVETLAHELRHVSEPRSWWEQDCPFRLRRELVGISRKSEDYLLDAIAQDLQWLDQEVARQFATRRNSKKPTIEKVDLQANLSTVELADTKRYRLLTRLGSSAAVIGGCLLGAPIGIIGSTGAWMLGEHLLATTVRSQQRVLTQKLEANIEAAIDHYCSVVGERLQTLYGQWIEDLRNEQQTWETTQRQILQNKLQPQSNVSWRSLEQQAKAIQQEISQTI